ncbi:MULTISPECIES: efflux RND transporter periplasmic adaptor subunit [Thalassospira]|uniref:Uncharacterized protein n=2 Tax=Thalassospira TaxID=168934 RepID=A0A367W3B0_9PROT|nr:MULTISPECIES: HlyD family efflux transporter periplasmic adaptor subunit [Thalassospira]MDG4720915.1 HlyD family efflux transporter periplasmic adaptor subunit [Thalassospira sp. FZY0004]RCK34894.1 hypothetical protein TH19_14295 [Thalassospira profundimaris]
MTTPTASAILLGIQKSIRQAQDMTALRFTVVTETRRLVAYQQAILLARGMDGKERVIAVSNVPTVDRNAPFVRFVEKLVNGEFSSTSDTQILTAADSEHGSDDWREFLQENLLCQPVCAPDGTRLGSLILSRANIWEEAEKLLVGQLVDALGHAWNALSPRKRQSAWFGDKKRQRIVFGSALALAAVAMFIPVPQSTIAPATVSPRDPVMVAAPIAGVIRDVAVRPNSLVNKGDLLFSFEDAELKANYEIALRAVDTAEAELRRSSQQAFGDTKGRAEVALQQTRLALRQEQAAFSQYQLSQVEVRAPQTGIAVFSDPNDWRGRPVSTGEQVMLLARPDDAELVVSIPVADAISLRAGVEVRFFLDIDPLASVPAVLEYAAYQPTETPEGILAYRAVARFEDQDNIPRIGLKGSAKVMGDDVPLALFLFRRPLSALRQMIGF